MADEPSKGPGPFDVKTIEFLVGLMSEHDLSEMDLCEGDQRIRLRRGNRVVSASAPAVPVQLPALAPTVAPVASAPPAQADPPAGRKLIDIKSPTIGTFYAQEKPDSPPYVTKGARVTPTTVVGLIEAMKLFNDIQAGCNGVIVEILVENQQAVEYNQILFRVDPSI